jgi:hypothetical protein
VGTPAVDLHHETLVAPQEVDLEAIELHVHLGPGKAVAAAEGEHPLLELGACAIRVERLAVRAVTEKIADLQTAEFGLTDGGVELGWGEEGAEVRQRPRGPRDRNAVASGAVRDSEGGGGFPKARPRSCG